MNQKEVHKLAEEASNNLICGLGFHDWEVLDVLPYTWGEDGFLLYNRVCLNCGKIDDQITLFKNQQAEKENYKKERQQIAKYLYDHKLQESQCILGINKDLLSMMALFLWAIGAIILGPSSLTVILVWGVVVCSLLKITKLLLLITEEKKS